MITKNEANKTVSEPKYKAQGIFYFKLHNRKGEKDIYRLDREKENYRFKQDKVYQKPRYGC